MKICPSCGENSKSFIVTNGIEVCDDCGNEMAMAKANDMEEEAHPDSKEAKDRCPDSLKTGTGWRN